MYRIRTLSYLSELGYLFVPEKTVADRLFYSMQKGLLKWDGKEAVGYVKTGKISKRTLFIAFSNIYDKDMLSEFDKEMDQKMSLEIDRNGLDSVYVKSLFMYAFMCLCQLMIFVLGVVLLFKAPGLSLAYKQFVTGIELICLSFLINPLKQFAIRK